MKDRRALEMSILENCLLGHSILPLQYLNENNFKTLITENYSTANVFSRIKNSFESGNGVDFFATGLNKEKGLLVQFLGDFAVQNTPSSTSQKCLLLLQEDFGDAFYSTLGNVILTTEEDEVRRNTLFIFQQELLKEDIDVFDMIDSAPDYLRSQGLDEEADVFDLLKSQVNQRVKQLKSEVALNRLFAMLKIAIRDFSPGAILASQEIERILRLVIDEKIDKASLVETLQKIK